LQKAVSLLIEIRSHPATLISNGEISPYESRKHHGKRNSEVV
jgi:hypothetical protein